MLLVSGICVREGRRGSPDWPMDVPQAPWLPFSYRFLLCWGLGIKYQFQSPRLSVGEWLFNCYTYPSLGHSDFWYKWSHICTYNPCMSSCILSIIWYPDFLQCIFWGTTRRKVFPLYIDTFFLRRTFPFIVEWIGTCRAHGPLRLAVLWVHGYFLMAMCGADWWSFGLFLKSPSVYTQKLFPGECHVQLSPAVARWLWLQQWLSASLTLWPFNKAPHVWWPQP